MTAPSKMLLCPVFTFNEYPLITQTGDDDDGSEMMYQGDDGLVYP